MKSHILAALVGLLYLSSIVTAQTVIAKSEAGFMKANKQAQQTINKTRGYKLP